jgi:predicted membrane protein
VVAITADWVRSGSLGQEKLRKTSTKEHEASRTVGGWQMSPEETVKRDRGPVIGGVVFIVVGVFLLLEKLGVVPQGFALHFWPSIFIVIGLVKIVYAGGRPTGAVLIALGIFLQLHEMGIIHLNFWEMWPVLIIVAGLAMLWQALVRESPTLSADPKFDALYIFGGGDRQVNTKKFKGGRLFALFGGYKIDFAHADIDGDKAVLEASAMFGGGEIRVPENWLVSVQGLGVFGAYEDKTRHFQPDPSKPTKTLVIKGVAIFGGIEVKN